MKAHIVDRPDEILNSNLFVRLSMSFKHKASIKVEGVNFSGFIKPKVARWMVDDMEKGNV